MVTGTEARRGLGPAWVGIALGVLVALAFVATTVLDDDGPRPLELGVVERMWTTGTVALVGAHVRNVGVDDVELLDASVPGADQARVGVPTRETFTRGADLQVRVRGARVPAGGSQLLLIQLRCPNAPELHRIALRFRVDGHETAQSLRLAAPVPVACP